MAVDLKQELADAIATVLLSHAAHGLATSSLGGVGEITLRDGLVAAAAAVGARTKRSWALKREVLPQGWKEANVDLMIYRIGHHNKMHGVAGVELKWWRQSDGGNASNRRRDLVKDFLRAASLKSLVAEASLVALLCTTDSWNSTTATAAGDQSAMQKLQAAGVEKWNVTTMASAAAVKNAAKALSGKVPVANTFHSTLLSSCSLTHAGVAAISAYVWSVTKPQNTRILTEAEIAALK